MILFRIRDWRKTQTNRTRRFCREEGDIRATVVRYGAYLRCPGSTCMYLSLICSQVEIQLEMYRWMNSAGRSTAVVNLRTTAVSMTAPVPTSAQV